MRIKYVRYLLSCISLMGFIIFGVQASCDERLRVGVILPLTGGLAEYGSAIRNGIEMARSGNPEVFDKLDFTYEDDQYDGKLTIKSYQKLVGVDRVNLLLTFGSIAGHALTPLVEQQKLVMINFGFEEDFAVGRPYVFRSMNHSEQYVQKLLDYLRREGVKRFEILNTELSFLNSMVAALKANLNKDEAVDVVATFNPAESDFRGAILKLKSKGIKKVGLFLLPNQVQAFVKQLHEMNAPVSLYGTDLFETAARLLPTGSLDGAVYPYNHVTESFKKRYLERYGSDVHLTFAGNAYDMATVVSKGFHRADASSVDKLGRELESVKDYPGALGSLSFRTSQAGAKYFEYPVVVKAIKGAEGLVVQ